jgi:hypothetical protein
MFHSYIPVEVANGPRLAIYFYERVHRIGNSPHLFFGGLSTPLSQSRTTSFSGWIKLVVSMNPRIPRIKHFPFGPSGMGGKYDAVNENR